MFMFWGKRTSYTKRLLKAKVRGEHETECEAQENNHHIVRNQNSPESSSSSSSPSSSKNNKNFQQNNHKNSTSTSNCGINHKNGCCYASASASASNYYSSSSSSSHGSPKIIINDHDIKSINDNYNNTDQQRTARCKELLKSLKENQLEMLLTAVESYGANLGACVMVKRRRRGSDVNIDAADHLKKNQEENSSRRIINGDDNMTTSDTESLPMITTTTNTSQQQQQQQIDRNPNNYYSHHHRGHHHNNHNRRVQLRGHCNIKDNVNRDDDDNYDDNNDDDNKLNKETLRRQIDYEDNIILGDRIMSTTTTATTTTTTTTTTNLTQRRSRNSGSNNNNNNNNEFPIDPHLLCCQIWRWPDLNNSSELKRLPVCHSAKDPVDICCNPYHWSRLCKPESPPPPYCLIADRLRPEDRAPSEGDVLHRYRNTNSPPLPGSLTTNGEDLSEQREWCTLAYWELGGRVGRLYPVEPSTVNVFDSLLDGDGLCLSNLAENHSTSPAIQKTRSKIGLGLMLSQESDGVWAYNRSENPIFVNSPTLDDPESRTLLVYRVPPGFCLNIFDREKTLKQSYSIQSSQISQGAQNFATGPVDVNSVRISFAKGWGPKYSRQEVTSCPCWLEVLLAPCR